jgi:hypothetical protein
VIVAYGLLIDQILDRVGWDAADVLPEIALRPAQIAAHLNED